MPTPPRTPSSTRPPGAVRATVADRSAPLADAGAFATAPSPDASRPVGLAPPPPSPLAPRERAARRRIAWRWAATVALTTLALSAVPHPVEQVVQPSGWPSPELQRAHPTEVADRQGFGLPFTTVVVQNGPSRRRGDWRAVATFGDGLAGALGLFAFTGWRRRRRQRRMGITA